MSKRNPGGKIKLTSYDELFGVDEEEAVSEEKEEFARSSDGQIVELPLDKLVEFNRHPFRVEDDEKMNETVESIKDAGVLVPILVRPSMQENSVGMYEILSGHRRWHASKLACKTSIPAIIKECSNDEAVIVMVDSNIQREDISVTEKAKAYRMKYDALKHRGTGGGSTLVAISENSGDNPKTIQRLIRLSFLSDDLLRMVEEKRLGLIQGVDISYLENEEQNEVFKQISVCNKNISLDQAALLKETFKNGDLTKAKIYEILEERKVENRKISFNSKKLDSYFTPDVSSKDIEKLILKLLDEWKERGGEA